MIPVDQTFDVDCHFTHIQVIAVSVLQPLLFSLSDLCLSHLVLLMASRNDVHDEVRPEGYMHSHTITRVSFLQNSVPSTGRSSRGRPCHIPVRVCSLGDDPGSVHLRS